MNRDEEVLPATPPPAPLLGRISVAQVDFSGAGSWGNGQVACSGYIHLALNAVNITDLNATGVSVPNDSAHPGAPLQCSRGMCQVIPPTFAAHHQGGTSLKIYDPVANVAAAINYIIATYGVARDGSDLAARVQQADPNRPPRGY